MAVLAAVPLAVSALAFAHAQGQPASWTEPQAPVRIFGNTYYVGTRGLSAILITSPTGAVLIDGAMREPAAEIARTSPASAYGSRTSS